MPRPEPLAHTPAARHIPSMTTALPPRFDVSRPTLREALAETLGVAAEIAAGNARGPGSFEPALLDALHALSARDIIEHARVRDEQG